MCVLAWFLCVCAYCAFVCMSSSTVRSGYRLKASPDQDSMKVLYYMEKELTQFPSAKMAPFKRKLAQTGPLSLICVAVWLCPCVCVSVFVFPVHGLCKLTNTRIHLIPSFNFVYTDIRKNVCQGGNAQTVLVMAFLALFVIIYHWLSSYCGICWNKGYF